jgi:hypothetical protein
VPRLGNRGLVDANAGVDGGGPALLSKMVDETLLMGSYRAQPEHRGSDHNGFLVRPIRPGRPFRSRCEVPTIQVPNQGASAEDDSLAVLGVYPPRLLTGPEGTARRYKDTGLQTRAKTLGA